MRSPSRTRSQVNHLLDEIFCSFTLLAEHSNICLRSQVTMQVSAPMVMDFSSGIKQMFLFSKKVHLVTVLRSCLALQGKDPTPWYSIYRWEYIRSLGISEVEFFEHPIACNQRTRTAWLFSGILAVSSENEKPNEAIISLFDERNLPPIFKTGIMDPSMAKYYLLIHDCHTENKWGLLIVPFIFDL